MTHVAHPGPHKTTPAELQADIDMQRTELASTVASLQERLDVKARARELTADLKDRATTEQGRPKPVVIGGAVGTGSLAAVGLWIRAHNHAHGTGRHPMHKLTMIAAGGVGYVLGARAGRERYEKIREGAQKVAASDSVREAADKLRHPGSHAKPPYADDVYSSPAQPF